MLIDILFPQAKLIKEALTVRDPSVIYVPEGGFGGNSNVNRKKFTILGETNSGKTCYLLGMYDELKMGIGKYTIVATNDDVDKNLTIAYNRMLDETLGQNRFPEITHYAEDMNFELKYSLETICSFDWVDYPGGFLDPATNDTSSKDYQQVAKNIQESSTLFICVDGKNLIEGSTEEKSKRVRRKSFRNIQSYISKLYDQLKQQNKKFPPIAIIITKYDLFKSEHDKDFAEIKKIISEAFEPMLRKDNFVAVIPCTLGTKISDNNYSGELDPVNIHLPILLGVNFALIESLAEYYALKNEAEKNISDMERSKKNEEGSFFLWRDDGYIYRLGRDINEMNREISNLEKTVRATKGNFYAINKELFSDEILYFANGKWQDEEHIKEIFENLQEMRFDKVKGW